jgi:antitoxin MazE
MRVSKWGNSLAIRIPAVVAEAMGLKEGDDVEVTVAGAKSLAVDRDRRREKALERIKAANWKLPPGWKFDREEANARGRDDE